MVTGSSYATDTVGETKSMKRHHPDLLRVKPRFDDSMKQ
jgi:hypothetical protein